MTALLLATPKDYVAYGSRFVLSGKYFALPGALTDDPIKGASLYNRHLIKKIKAQGNTQSRKHRVVRIAQRFANNRRIKRVNSAIKAAHNNELICIQLTQFERDIFFMLF